MGPDPFHIWLHKADQSPGIVTKFAQHGIDHFHIGAMPVHKDNAIEAVMDQAAPDIVQDCQERRAAQGNRAPAPAWLMHMLRRVADPNGWCVQHADHLGHAAGHLNGRDRIRVQRQMGAMLLQAGHGHNDEVFLLQVGLDVDKCQIP